MLTRILGVRQRFMAALFAGKRGATAGLSSSDRQAMHRTAGQASSGTLRRVFPLPEKLAAPYP